jgi:hypothetical protein
MTYASRTNGKVSGARVRIKQNLPAVGNMTVIPDRKERRIAAADELLEDQVVGGVRDQPSR